MRRILFSLMVIAVVAAMIGGGTLAWFSDTAESESNSFTAGTLSIDDNLVAQTDAIEFDPMAPGDVTEEFVVTIKNDGSINLGWLGDWQFAGGTDGAVDLKDALYIHSAKMEFLKPDGTDTWEPADTFITDGRGSGLYPGWYNTLADLSPFRVVTFNNWDGNNGMGVTPHEHMGALKPDYSYRLTVKFGFAKQAGNDYQGLGPVTAKLVVKATQINAEALEAIAGHTSAWGDHVNWMNAQIGKQN